MAQPVEHAAHVAYVAQWLRDFVYSYQTRLAESMYPGTAKQQHKYEKVTIITTISG
jgi:hypothetical protein